LIEGDEALGDGIKGHTWSWAYTKSLQNDNLTQQLIDQWYSLKMPPKIYFSIFPNYTLKKAQKLKVSWMLGVHQTLHIVRNWFLKCSFSFYSNHFVRHENTIVYDVRTIPSIYLPKT